MSAQSITLGNLGLAESKCIHQYLKLKDSFKIQCTKGTISQLQAYGLMPDDTYKVSKQFEPDFCGKETDHKSINECTHNWFKIDQFEQFYKTNCEGQDKCEFNFNDYFSKENQKNYVRGFDRRR